MENICHCAERRKERGSKEKKQLINRVSRIEGQINGIKKMIEGDRYCPDILIQISAVKSALASLSKVMLTEHINTCVLSDIKCGKESAAEELAELIEKLK